MTLKLQNHPTFYYCKGDFFIAIFMKEWITYKGFYTLYFYPLPILLVLSLLYIHRKIFFYV